MTNFTLQAPQLTDSDLAAARLAIAFTLLPSTSIKLSPVEKQSLQDALTKLCAAVWFDD